MSVDSDGEPVWLEQDAVGGFRVWQLIFLCFGCFLTLMIVLCCCFRFRIPRTKQDIEADYQRRKIAKKFRERLACIQNSEMDDMDLQKALDRVRADFIDESSKKDENDEKKNNNNKLNTICNDKKTNGVKV